MAKRAKKWGKNLANEKIAIKEGQEKVLDDTESVIVSVQWNGSVDLDNGCVLCAGDTLRSTCWHNETVVAEGNVEHIKYIRVPH